MKLRQNHRVPALLLACLVVALVFPDSCAGTRARLGAWLPRTAGGGAQGEDPAIQDLREGNARMAFQLLLAREEAEARARDPVEPLRGVRHAPRKAAARPIAVTARVLHRDASNLRRSFLIDAGSADGLYRGLPVVHGNSLCGVLMTVSTHASRVLRIDDVSLDAALPALVVDPDPQAARPRRGAGVARGTGDGLLRVGFLADGEARVGDFVLTGPGRYPVPEGLVLGRVARFADDDRNGNWEAEVEPLRDLESLGTVLVLRSEPLPAEVAPR